MTPLYAKKDSGIKFRKVNLKKIKQKKKKKTRLRVFKRQKKSVQKKIKASSADLFIRKKEMEKIELLNRQIKNNEEIVADFDDQDGEKAVYLFKLAMLYGKKAKTQWFKAMSFDDIDPKNKQHAKELEASKTQFLKRSENTTRKAIKTYEEIYDKFVDFKDMDLVLFSWAHTLDEMKQRTLGLQVYQKLIKEYRDSKFVPAAYLAIGEYYFSGDDMATAKSAYQKVVEFGKTQETYNYAKYKLGWCEFNLKDYKKAFRHFAWILVKSKEQNKKFIEQLKADLVFVYSQFLEPEKAEHYFKRLFGDPAYIGYLEKLAYLYKDRQGNHDDAETVFDVLLALSPKKLKELEYQIALLDIAIARNKLQPLIAASLTTGKSYELVKKDPVLGKSKAFKEIGEGFEGIIKELATNFHNQAKETRNDRYLKVATKFYKEYQLHFREYKDFYPMLFQYAQLLDDELGEQQEAIDVYLDIIKSKEGKKAKNLVEDSVNNALAIYADLIRQEQATKKGRRASCHRSKSYKKQQLTRRQGQFIDLIDVFITHNPTSKEIPTARFNAGKIYYESCDFDRAKIVFSEILTKYVGSDPYESSASLTLDILNIEKEYTQMLTWINEFLKHKKHFSKTFLKELNENIEALAFMSPQELEKKKRYADAGKAYYSFYQEYPKSRRAFPSLYNSSLMYERAGYIQDTIRIREEILANKRYAKKKETKDLLFFLAQNYQGLTKFKPAAEKYEAFYKKYARDARRDKKVLVALKAAIDFYEISGSFAKSNRLIDIYADQKRYRNKRRSPWEFRKVENLEKMKNWRKYVKAIVKYERDYRPFINIDRQLEIVFKLGDAYAALGNKKAAEKQYAQAFKQYKRLTSRQQRKIKNTRKLLAGFRFKQLNKTYQKFKKIRLKLPRRVMERAIVKKMKMQKVLNKLYNDAAKEFKSAYWTIAFYFKIASLTYDFAQDLRNAPIPKGLKKEEQEIYSQDLEQMYILPMEQQAFNTYYQCYKIAMRNEIFNEWVDRAITMMRKIDEGGFKVKYDELFATIDFQDVLFQRSEPIVTGESVKKVKKESVAPISKPQKKIKKKKTRKRSKKRSKKRKRGKRRGK